MPWEDMDVLYSVNYVILQEIGQSYNNQGHHLDWKKKKDLYNLWYWYMSYIDFTVHKTVLLSFSWRIRSCFTKNCYMYLISFPILFSKRNFFEAAFLLEKSVCQWICSYKKIIKTLCQGQWPRGTGENGTIKVAFLSEKSVPVCLQSKPNAHLKTKLMIFNKKLQLTFWWAK